MLGVVEGLTEFLPVSSTGHLILTARFLGLPESEFLKSFEVMIQLGAILAVVVVYARSLLVRVEVLKRLLAAFIPTGVAGLVLYKFIKKFLLGNADVVVASLFLGGLFLVIFEKFYREEPGAKDDLSRLSYRDAVLIGLCQSLAMVPGVSRSAATIIGGLVLGLRRKTIVEFSFLLAIPTMLAASAFDLLKSAGDFSLGEGALSFLAVGFGASFVVAMLSIKFFLHFIQRNDFSIFGFYRILAAVAFYIFLHGA
ncbi:MAG TPA: undecaprenyl-diphosphatase UppP [Candidatus Omnitrophota bacterium]|nr:undecaprenyl-diphosphatase UppP [Candidatus Omnitrophota bacterium]